MATYVKKCGFCRFDIPREATICGHCGARYETLVSERHLGVRILFGLWGLIKGVFMFTIFSLIIAYFFADPEDIEKWALIAGLLGAFVGFADELHKSKEKRRVVCHPPA